MINLRYSLAPRMLVLILAFYFCVVLLFYVPNMGGAGLNLPQNILCWLAMELVVLLAGLVALRQQSLNWNVALLCFAAGTLLMTMPMLWGAAGLQIYALPRFAGLWGGVIFYLALLQFRLSPGLKRKLLLILIGSALMQCLLAFWQASQTTANNLIEFVPGTRPYGIFQQVNVLASFVATGFAGTVWCLFRARQWQGRVVCLLCIAIFTMMLDILQSRAGVIGVLFYTLFVALIRFHPRKKGVWAAYIGVVVLSVITLHLMKFYGVNFRFLQQLGTVDKAGTTFARVVILKATVEMISQHPLSGWGYGSFEYVLNRIALKDFQHLLCVDHAHNEFLFEWAEGGVMAVAGMCVILVGFFMPLHQYTRGMLACWGLGLPIAVHMMLEYPLMQSVPHWLTLLLLFRLATPERMPKMKHQCRPFGWLMPLTAAIALAFLFTGFRTGIVLTQFERAGMTDLNAVSSLGNPWIQWDRWQYDQHTAMLMRYNLTRDTGLLKAYTQWGELYLQRHNDLRVFQNLVSINRVMPDISVKQRLQTEWESYYAQLAAMTKTDKRQVN